ncbi:BrnT family toxin [Arhodomonas sp. SL1]|uniref:BrnT family toxin n=1 Tax=Arhodomonas sp. SL1 TaxID=3425691 RepID=UPI003F880E36
MFLPAGETALTVPQARGEPKGGRRQCTDLGADSLGRILGVVHTSRGESVRIISARKASRNEASNYHA